MNNAPFVAAGRISNVTLSAIIRMGEAARLRAEAGHNVINLGIGEPDFLTPDHAGDAAIDAIKSGDTKYPPVAGTIALREAVAQLYDRRGGVRRHAENVLISSGSKYTLLNAFLASVNQDDEVILPAPFWTAYKDIIQLCGGKPVVIETGAATGFKPTAAQIAVALTPRTRWLLLNTPNNPSGAVIQAKELCAIGDVIAAHPQCWLMSDEIYENIVYCDGGFTSIADALPNLAERSLIVSGVSKSYAMTGWRVGYGVGPTPLIKAMTRVQAQGTSGTATISQAAALAAITGDQMLLADRRYSFQSRRDLVCQRLAAINRVNVSVPDGAFYVFPSWHDLIGSKTPKGQTLNTDLEFCTYILESADVVVIPGDSFALPGHFRISYATAEADLIIAMDRLSEAILRLQSR